MTSPDGRQGMAANMLVGGTARSRIKQPNGTILAPPSTCKVRITTQSGCSIFQTGRLKAAVEIGFYRYVGRHFGMTVMRRWTREQTSNQIGK